MSRCVAPGYCDGSCTGCKEDEREKMRFTVDEYVEYDDMRRELDALRAERDRLRYLLGELLSHASEHISLMMKRGEVGCDAAYNLEHLVRAEIGGDDG